MFDLESSFTAISGLEVLYVNGDRIPWEPLTLPLIYHYYSCLKLVCGRIKSQGKPSPNLITWKSQASPGQKLSCFCQKVSTVLRFETELLVTAGPD